MFLIRLKSPVFAASNMGAIYSSIKEASRGIGIFFNFISNCGSLAASRALSICLSVQPSKSVHLVGKSISLAKLIIPLATASPRARPSSSSIFSSI